MDCTLLRAHLGAYVDHELEPSPVVEFEQHLAYCSGCRDELALTRMLKQGVCAGVRDVPAPASLQLKLQRALDQEDAVHSRGSGRWAGALAVAAVLALALGAVLRPSENAPTAGVQTAGLLSDIVAQHREQLPADVASDEPEQVTPWFRGRLAFRVRSVRFAEPHVRFAGARVSRIGNQQAARFYYNVGDSRVTMLVFKEAPPELHRALHGETPTEDWQRERIGSRVLTYRNVQGYTVPVIEHDGIVYAFTGDLDQQRLLRLVASAQLP